MKTAMKTYDSVYVSLLLNVVFFYVTSVDGTVQFSFTQPSSNCIANHSTAVHKCSVDGVQPGDIVTLIWTVNGNSSSLLGPFQSYIDSIGITAGGLGTHTLTLTIPGNTGLNGTIVECGAFGLVDGSAYTNTSTSDPLLVAVPRIRQLSLNLNYPFSFTSTWKQPYMCGSDIKYMYNVTVRNGSTDAIIRETSTNLTQYNESDLGFGTYIMSVIVDGLQGDMENSSITIEKGDIEWTMKLTRVNEVLMAYINTTNNEPRKLLRIEHVPDSIEINNNDSSANLSNIGKVKGRAILVLNYNESQIHSDISYTIDTLFNVKGLSHDSYDNGSVCFQCTYHSYAGSSQGCTVEYSSTDGTVHHSFDISRDENNMCINNISSSTYNITVYDMDELDSPAYQITNQFIHVLEPSSSSVISTSEISSPTTRTSTDSTPSTTTTQSPDPAGPPFVTIIIIVIAILLIIVLTIVIVILVCCILKRGRKKLKSPVIHCQKSDISNYIEPRFDDNSSRPMAPLSTVNNMAFSYVAVKTEAISNSSGNEEYSRLNRTVQQGNLSDGIYNKLQREKPQLPESLTLHTTDIEQYSTLPGGVSRANITEPELTYKLLITNLASRISHKWCQFGKALAITPPMLKEIQENHPNNDRDKLCDVIQEWMDSNPRPFTWATLQNVLTIIDEAHLLQSIEESCV